MPGFDSRRLRHALRGHWGRRVRTAFWWLVAGVFIVGAVGGLIYLIYERSAR
jgi:hypothetical protein